MTDNYDEEEFEDLDLPDDSEISSDWVIAAETVNRTMAEFAINGLKSYEIPAVLDGRPGVFGSAGLPLRSLTDGRLETFRIMVPAEFEAEAREVVKLFLAVREGDPDEDSEEDDDEEWG